ncbi:MAG: GNAT family N-acetyltransferase [Steroidobacteraceae bacterium]
MLSVEALRGADALAALAGDWRTLAATQAGCRFYHWYGWWKCCVGILEPDPDAVTFFVVRRGSRPVAIVPLRRSADGGAGLGARVWRLPQHPHMPLSDIVCSAGLGADELLEALLPALGRRAGRGWDALTFEPVPAGSPLAQLRAVPAGSIRRTTVKICEEIPTCAREEDHRTRLSPNFRSNLNKARNKLAREPAVEFQTALRPAEQGAALAAFMELEASGWKGREGTAIAQDPRLRAFYRGLVEELAPQGRVAIHSLRVAGRLIAGQFCLQDDDTLYVLKLAYDEDWSRVAPGNMLLEHLVLGGAGAGIRRINLVGNPAWFRDWRPVGSEVHCHWISNATIRGRALSGLLDVKRRLRPLYRQAFARPAAGRGGGR